MKLSATLALFAAAFSIPLFGQAELPWAAVGQGGAIGVLGWSVWYLLSKHIPAQTKTFVETVTRLSDRQHEDSEKLNETLSQLRAHCAAQQRSPARPMGREPNGAV